MTWKIIDDPKFLGMVQLVDLDIWGGGIIFPRDREVELAEYWERKNKIFLEKMNEIGRGHFTWQMPHTYVGPRGQQVTTHSAPTEHYHYYIGKSDEGGFQFRLPIT